MTVAQITILVKLDYHS